MPDNYNPGGRLDRRSVLKTVGATAVTSGLISTASASSSDIAVSGLAYDTLTHIAMNPVSGNITRSARGLSGNVLIAGYEVPLDRLSSESTDSKDDVMHAGSLTGERYVEDGSPLHVRIFDHGDHFSGTLGRPSGQFGTVGFHFRDANKFDSEAAKENHTRARKWEGHPASFSVPERGIPTDSAPSRIIEWTRERNDLTEVER